jgi:hypothetical protein
LLSASINFTLGVVHLVYTFWGPKLTPRDPALQISRSQIAPVITKETTMWRCWVGFNASHSMGLILFGLVLGFLALAHGQLRFQSPFLFVVGLATLGGFVVFSVCLSQASAFLSPAMSPALRYRGALIMAPDVNNDNAHEPERAGFGFWADEGLNWPIMMPARA